MGKKRQRSPSPAPRRSSARLRVVSPAPAVKTEPVSPGAAVKIEPVSPGPAVEYEPVSPGRADEYEPASIAERNQGNRPSGPTAADLSSHDRQRLYIASLSHLKNANTSGPDDRDGSGSYDDGSAEENNAANEDREGPNEQNNGSEEDGDGYDEDSDAEKSQTSSESSDSSFDRQLEFIHGSVRDSVRGRSRGLMPPPLPDITYERFVDYHTGRISRNWADGAFKTVEEIVGREFFGEKISMKVYKRLVALSDRTSLEVAKDLLREARQKSGASVSSSKMPLDMQLTPADVQKAHELLNKRENAEDAGEEVPMGPAEREAHQARVEKEEAEKARKEKEEAEKAAKHAAKLAAKAAEPPRHWRKGGKRR